MKLLGHFRVGPRRPALLVDVLEGDARLAGSRMLQDEPILSAPVRLISRRRLVARAVRVAEQLAVELRQTSRVGGIQDYLQKGRMRVRMSHQRALWRIASPAVT